MREPQENCTQSASPPVTAETIINDFMWLGPMAAFEEGLHELFVSFVYHEDNLAEKYKDNIFFTYNSLRELIKQVEILQTQKIKL